LIQRFYDPTNGEILFSGKNIKELEPRWYKKQISIVSQEPVLFSGTIRENLCYGLDID
jgi:ABC-type multidrug transport system fused ATPase/permease subunit